MTAEQEMTADIGSFAADPYGFAMYAYPWGEMDLKEVQGPREWQGKVMQAVGSHLSNPETRFQPCQIAVASGHGIGKSALVSMLIDWAMSTCVDCRVIVTANTKNQLDTKTGPEVRTWFNRSINAHWWEITATKIRAKETNHEAIWRTDFIPWSETNTQAFAGTHNKGKRILIIEDEASEIADIISEVIQGALTDEGTEIIWCKFGNPTRNTGAFRECFGKFRHRWKTFQIDSRTVDGTNKALLAKWIEDYGEDSDYVRVRVRGEFPRIGISQYIPGDAVAAARLHKAEGYEGLPKILAVDVARQGEDESVIGIRQGRRFRILERMRIPDLTQVAFRTMRWMDSEQPDAVVVDGDGLGAGVVDNIRLYNYGAKLHEFHGGATPDDTNAYFNRRAEVWGLGREWLIAGGVQVDDDPGLEQDLISPQYGFTAKGQIQLEKKEDMKRRGMNSPDSGDCWAMTFAVKVLPKAKRPITQQQPSSGSWMS